MCNNFVFDGRHGVKAYYESWSEYWCGNFVYWSKSKFFHQRSVCLDYLRLNMYVPLLVWQRHHSNVNHCYGFHLHYQCNCVFSLKECVRVVILVVSPFLLTTILRLIFVNFEWILSILWTCPLLLLFGIYVGVNIHSVFFHQFCI